MDRSKIAILVTGTMNAPWDANWKECAATWIPLLRKLGYCVKIALGDPDIEGFSDEGDIIRFKALDDKSGLLDKRVIEPIKWILGHTDHEYYFVIDSDCFVHPKRLDEMLAKNIAEFSPDYMGACLPYPGFNPNKPLTTWMERQDAFEKYASGTAYMISRKAMPKILEILGDKELAAERWGYSIDRLNLLDDKVLGMAMHEIGIRLLHEAAICFESKWNVIIYNPHGLKMPCIEEKDSHLAIQHYQNGHMAEIMLELIS